MNLRCVYIHVHRIFFTFFIFSFYHSFIIYLFVYFGNVVLGNHFCRPNFTEIVCDQQLTTEAHGFCAVDNITSENANYAVVFEGGMSFFKMPHTFEY